MSLKACVLCLLSADNENENACAGYSDLLIAAFYYDESRSSLVIQMKAGYGERCPKALVRSINSKRFIFSVTIFKPRAKILGYRLGSNRCSVELYKRFLGLWERCNLPLGGTSGMLPALRWPMLLQIIVCRSPLSCMYSSYAPGLVRLAAATVHHENGRTQTMTRSEIGLRFHLLYHT